MAKPNTKDLWKLNYLTIINKKLSVRNEKAIYEQDEKKEEQMLKYWKVRRILRIKDGFQLNNNRHTVVYRGLKVVII